MCVCVCVYIYMSIYFAYTIRIRLSLLTCALSLLACLSVCLSACRSVCMSVYQSIYLSICRLANSAHCALAPYWASVLPRRGFNLEAGVSHGTVKLTAIQASDRTGMLLLETPMVAAASSPSSSSSADTSTARTTLKGTSFTVARTTLMY